MGQQLVKRRCRNRNVFLYRTEGHTNEMPIQKKLLLSGFLWYFKNNWFVGKKKSNKTCKL